MSKNKNLSLTYKLPSNRSLGYIDVGDPKGRPVIFLHGWPSSRLFAASFHDVGIKLKARILAVDRPGIGLSTSDKEGDSLTFADDLGEFIKGLKLENSIMIGVSGGGPYLLAAASKLGSQVKTYAISQGMGMVWKKENYSAYKSIANRFHWRVSGLSKVYRQLMWFDYLVSKVKLFRKIHTLFMMSNKKDTDLVSDYFDNYVRDNQEAYRQGASAVIKDLKFYTTGWQFDITKIPEKIYIYHGAQDQAVPVRMAEEIDSLLPYSKLKIFEDTGHFVIRFHTEEILKELLEV